MRRKTAIATSDFFLSEGPQPRHFAISGYLSKIGGTGFKLDVMQAFGWPDRSERFYTRPKLAAAIFNRLADEITGFEARWSQRPIPRFRPRQKLTQFCEHLNRALNAEQR